MTVKAKEQETQPVTAAVTGKKNAFVGDNLAFGFRLGNMKRVATVSFTFEKDAALQYAGFIGKNGFTPLGIKWNDDHTATIALSYLQDGAGGSVTKTQLADVAEVQFAELLYEMSVGIKLLDISAAGYDENGKAVYFTTKIAAASASTTVSDQPSCDVNGDGVVDLLDITYCQKYYRKDDSSSDWKEFKQCDVDGSGLIDIQDLILILKAM